MEIKINEQDTSIGRVQTFLDYTRDNNQIHQNPELILPGAFYYVLAYPHMKEQNLAGLTMKFKGMTKYPTSMVADIEDSRMQFKQENVLAECSFQYDENNQEGIVNDETERFAELMGIKPTKILRKF